jgi:hypothetical protein
MHSDISEQDGITFSNYEITKLSPLLRPYTYLSLYVTTGIMK